MTGRPLKAGRTLGHGRISASVPGFSGQTGGMCRLGVAMITHGGGGNSFDHRHADRDSLRSAIGLQALLGRGTICDRTVWRTCTVTIGRHRHVAGKRPGSPNVWYHDST